MHGFADVWRSLGDRIGFYTKETKDRIPEVPGIYAWFLPLWIYDNSIERLIDVLDRITLYDADCKGPPQKSVVARFRWDELGLQVTKHGIKPLPDGKEEPWADLLQDPTVNHALQKTLMMASVFMPPLYVGKAQSLSIRYQQHVSGSGKKNTFHRRFTDHISSLTPSPNLQVSDLIFACIRTEEARNKAICSDELNDILEAILLRLCKPAFSER